MSLNKIMMFYKILISTNTFVYLYFIGSKIIFFRSLLPISSFYSKFMVKLLTCGIRIIIRNYRTEIIMFMTSKISIS